jgi:hypothetical protein
MDNKKEMEIVISIAYPETIAFLSFQGMLSLRGKNNVTIIK